MKLRRTFQYKDIDLRIVDVEEQYMNSENLLLMTRVLAPNGGQIPVKVNRNDRLKDIVSNTIIVLDGLEARGADVIGELTKEIKK